MKGRVLILLFYAFVNVSSHVNAWEAKLTITEMDVLKRRLADDLAHNHARKAGSIGILARPPEVQGGRFLQAWVFRHPDKFVLIHIAEVPNIFGTSKGTARVCIIADKLDKSQFEELTKNAKGIAGLDLDSFEFPCLIKDVDNKLWDGIEARLEKFEWGEDVGNNVSEQTLKLEDDWGFIESNLNGTYTCYATNFRGDPGRIPNIQGMLLGLERFLRVHLAFSTIVTSANKGDSKKNKASQHPEK